MSRADDGARPVLVGGAEEDAGITSHGVTRASMLRPGQSVQFNTSWVKITAVTVDGTTTTVHLGEYWPVSYNTADMVPVRDILHTYTDKETS